MTEDQYFNTLQKVPSLPNVGISEKLAEQIINPLINKGYETQYTKLNNLIGGLKMGSFMVIGAEQGRGKSLLVLNLLLDMHTKGIKSCYIDIENYGQKTWRRLLMINYQLDNASIDKLSKEEILQMANSINNISWYEETHLTPLVDENTRLKDVALQLINDRIDEGHKVFVIDPFSRFCEDSPENSMYEEGVFAGELADLSVKRNVCIIVVHHLRKGGKNIRAKSESDVEEVDYAVPTLESFRGSSKIIDRATEVVGLVRFPKDGDIDKVQVRILKSRTGSTGDFYLEFDKRTLTFNNQYEHPLIQIFKGNAVAID